MWRTDKKRSIVRPTVCLLVLAALLLITACSGGGTPSATPSGTAANAPKKSIELVYQTWYQPYIDFVVERAEAYQKLHPELDFKVKTEIFPFAKYWEKILTQAAGNALPDIFDMNGPNFYDYVSRGQLLSLQPYLPKSQYKESDFIQSIQDLYRYKGELYGVTGAMDGSGMYYNKKIFDDNNVPYPDDTWDLNKFREVAKKLTKPGEIYGAFVPSSLLDALPFLFSNGGQIYNADKTESLVNSQVNIDTMQLLQDMIFVDKSAPDKASTPNNNPLDMFRTGKIAMYFGLNTLVPTLMEVPSLDWDVAPYPKGSAGRTVVTHGPARVVAANSGQKETAADFTLFLGTKESVEKLAKTNLSSRKDLQQEFVKTYPGKNIQVLVDSTAYATLYPSTANFNLWNTEVGKQADLLKLNQTTPKQALQAIDQKLNEALKAVPKEK